MTALFFYLDVLGLQTVSNFIYIIENGMFYCDFGKFKLFLQEDLSQYFLTFEMKGNSFGK